MKVKIIKPEEKGQKEIKFHPGGLHESTNTPAEEKIPKSKVSAALAGKDGPKAKRQALFMKNVLTGGK